MVKALVFGTKDLCVRIAPWSRNVQLHNFFPFWNLVTLTFVGKPFDWPRKLATKTRAGFRSTKGSMQTIIDDGLGFEALRITSPLAITLTLTIAKSALRIFTWNKVSFKLGTLQWTVFQLSTLSKNRLWLERPFSSVETSVTEHARMSASLPGKRELPASQYDLSTYWGRVKQSAQISDPRWGPLEPPHQILVW